MWPKSLETLVEEIIFSNVASLLKSDSLTGIFVDVAYLLETTILGNTF